MIKRIIIVALLVATLLLTACFDEHETETAPQKAEARLVIVDRSTTYRIYADKETRVMYLQTKQGYGEALCVMVDADGRPLMWEGALS